jgi:glutamyl-tRNA reductase
VQLIQVLGTNHRQAPVAARERLVADGSASTLVEEVRVLLGASECVLLPTCNRVELYYLAAPDPARETAAKALLCGADEDVCLSPDSVYHFAGAQAMRHLFAVASGLDSMVLGEYEILGQVKAAAPAAASNGWAGPVLKRLFDHAVRAGKRARRETAISSGIFSVGQCAARMAEEVIGRLARKQVLVFGAGRVARVTAKHMASLGVDPIVVFSRTREKACSLAAACGGRAVAAEELPAVIEASDIVVGCASAPHYVIGTADLEPAVRGRHDRPLVVVDLGVPRNVDPAVAQMPGVHLFNIDDLEQVVAQHAGEREREVDLVRAIVDEEARAFEQWLDERSVSELITQLRTKAESVRQECLWLAERKLPDQDLPTVAYLLDLLVRKLLHDPISAIRGAATAGDPEVDLATAARQLFALQAEAQAEPEVVPEPVLTARDDAGS